MRLATVILLLATLLPPQLGCGSGSSSPSGDIAAQKLKRRQLVARRTTHTTIVVPERPAYPPNGTPTPQE
jgi:hypothetical protein